jgi:hypothetical protein
MQLRAQIKEQPSSPKVHRQREKKKKKKKKEEKEKVAKAGRVLQMAQ